MKYLGGKSRTAKKIVESLPPCGGTVWEPFMGGGWVTARLTERYDKVIASDMHDDPMTLYKWVSDGWEPPAEFLESDYHHWKYLDPEPGSEEAATKAFCGYACSFGGRYYAGYARGGPRNYAAEGRRSIARKQPGIARAELRSGSYETVVQTQPGDLVYCDPPFANTTGYQFKFDSEEFWRWAERLAKSGVLVYVSEYTAPEGWEEVWAEDLGLFVRRVDGDNRMLKRTEKLYTWRGNESTD